VRLLVRGKIEVHVPGPVVGMSGWIIAISHDEAAPSISQYVIDLRLGKLAIGSRTDAHVRRLEHIIIIIFFFFVSGDDRKKGI